MKKLISITIQLLFVYVFVILCSKDEASPTSVGGKEVSFAGRTTLNFIIMTNQVYILK